MVRVQRNQRIFVQGCFLVPLMHHDLSDLGLMSFSINFSKTKET